MFLEMLPDFFQKSLETAEIQTAIESVYEGFKNAVDDLENQMYIDTATWALTYWEQLYALPNGEGKDISERRANIKSRLRGYGTCTKEHIRNVAESFTNGSVTVIEHPEEYAFSITFTSVIGIPPNIEDLEKTIEAIKPAHLSVTYIFTYRTWDDVSHLTWGEANIYSWEELKSKSEVLSI